MVKMSLLNKKFTVVMQFVLQTMVLLGMRIFSSIHLLVLTM